MVTKKSWLFENESIPTKPVYAHCICDSMTENFTAINETPPSIRSHKLL